MTLSLTAEQTRRLRLGAQWLDPDFDGTVAQVVKQVCGIQAQELPAAGLSIRARSPGITAVEVEQARLQSRSLLRTWAMRGTLHLLETEDYGWMLPLLGPVFIRADERRRRQLGLDKATSIHGVSIIRETLSRQGYLTREEIAPFLKAAGIPTQGQALIHLIAHAALEGILCCGPERGGKPSYVLVEDWIGRKPFTSLSREAALAELARRYLNAYGPANLNDLAAWSGLMLSELRPAFQRIVGEMIPVEISEKLNWLPKDRLEWIDPPRPECSSVRLLPRFDTYLLGYSNRKLVVPPEQEKRIHPGGGILHPVLLVDGAARGVWSLKTRRARVEVLIEPFADLPGAVRQGLEAEVASIGHFFRLEPEWVFARPDQVS